MTRLVISDNIFDAVTPNDEKSFEDAIRTNAKFIFGEGRYYLDCKRRIGAKGKKGNIPDAYLIDLRRNAPRLFVVENELAAHDLFKHIGVQLLELSYSYSQSGRRLIKILYEEIVKIPDIRAACENYAREKGYRNLDNMLDYLVNETSFQAIVIIDEATTDLFSTVKNFSFPVEIIEFITYEDNKGNMAFRFKPFLKDVIEMKGETGIVPIDIGEIDTIVVPAHEEGFKDVFLGENCWYAISIHSSMIPQIKHIAVYQVAPISAITHLAPISKVLPWKDTGKYCIEFAEPAREINLIKLDPSGRVRAPQRSRYTSLLKFADAKTLDDVF